MPNASDHASDISRHIVDRKKQIFILNGDGFGNKVFDLIRGVYLYNLYGGRCVVNYIPYMSKHEAAGDPTIGEIFPNVGEKINLMQHLSYKHLVENKTHFDKLCGFKTLNDLPEYSALGPYTKICVLFNLTFEMYKTFNAEDRRLFTINKNMIQDKHNILMRIHHMQYAAIHIRYGDKLKYCAESDEKTFLVYTPQYYVDMIKHLRQMGLNTKMPVYIVTDSNKVVDEFILKKHFKDDPFVELIQTQWLDAFYVISHASIIVMSCSTFCFAAAYFNSKNPKCFLALNVNGRHFSPEERAINPDWKIVYDKKYVLNDNKPLAIEMNKYNAIKITSVFNSIKNASDLNSIKPYITDKATVAAMAGKKQIYIRDRHDLGGRIFSLVQAVYLQKLYKKECDINYVEYPSETPARRPPAIDVIFNKTAGIINFISPAQYEKLLPLLSDQAHTEKCGAELSQTPSLSDLDQLNRFCRQYELTGDMVATFTEKDFKLFTVNPELISSELVALSREKYAIVYVSYGLLLNYANKDTVDFDHFLIYTPQYFIDMIQYLHMQDSTMPIFIITDTPGVVDNYILPGVSQINVTILDKATAESFYLMTYASYIIASDRPICFAGMLFTHKTGAEFHMVMYRDPDSIHLNSRSMAASFYAKLNVSHDRRYILNYNKPLSKELLAVCLGDPRSNCHD